MMQGMYLFAYMYMTNIYVVYFYCIYKTIEENSYIL